MKRFYRSAKERKIAGVCGGLGELMELDPNLVRLLFFFVGFITGFIPLLITYVAAWIFIPENGPNEREESVPREN